MKKQWKLFIPPLGARGLLYAAAVMFMTLSCKKQDRTTVVFGTVKDDLGKPIAGVEMNLYGNKGAFAAQLTLLKTAKTDTKGEYSITIDISKDYHSGDLDLNFDMELREQYTNSPSRLYFNGNETRDCCRVSIGQKNQYDWVLFRK